MAFNQRKFKIRLNKNFSSTPGTAGKVGLMSQRRITVNGQVVRPGKQPGTAAQPSALKAVVTSRTDVKAGSSSTTPGKKLKGV